MLRQHCGYNSLVCPTRLVVNFKGVFHLKAHTATMSRNAKQSICHGYGRRTDVEAFHMDVSPCLGCQQAHHYMTGGQFQKLSSKRQCFQNFAPV